MKQQNNVSKYLFGNNDIYVSFHSIIGIQNKS